jgi:hypothetical protein
MNLKFFLEFENVQGDTCTVNFLYADYEGDPIRLFGGARPFVLSEFNTDNDLFKPVRPQQATIEVLASAAGVRMEDFIADNDEDVLIRFDFGEFTGYWYGYLSQEDIQETWIAQNHILTLRADDGFGRLKTIPLSDDGARLVGTFTPFQLTQYAMQTPVVTFLKSRVISNLYHTSMSSASNTTGIEQCTIDARTFETAPNEFEDSYTVLEKINRAWSSTLFQWNGDWFVLRIEEMFTDGNLIGFRQNVPVVGQRTGINQRYDMEVGVMKDVKPVVPEMIKTLQKPSKQTTINYDWEKFVQIVCNETFQEGTETENFVGGTGTQKFTVEQWNHQKNSITSPAAATGTFERRVEYENYKIADDYIYIGFETGDTWVRSCNIYVTELDSVDIEFQYKVENSPGNARNQIVAVLLLYASDGTKYALSRLRQWVQWTNDGEIVKLFLADSIPPTDWTTFNQSFDDNTGIPNQEIPKAGYLNFLFYYDVSELSGGGVYYKDFNLNITSIAERNRRRVIRGDYDRYTIAKNVAKNYEETIYLDDAATNVYKGAIYEDDGFTLTDDEWYRRRYNTERYTFKRQHAIARWFMNRSYKTKLDVNLYGLKWDISGTDYPIGIMNTLKFVDDAPTKIYAITNLKEVDFMSCIWSASLVEVYDTTVDQDVPGDTDVHTFDFYYE